MEDIVRIATELENLKIAFLEDVFGFGKNFKCMVQSYPVRDCHKFGRCTIGYGPSFV